MGSNDRSRSPRLGDDSAVAAGFEDMWKELVHEVVTSVLVHPLIRLAQLLCGW